MFTPSVTHLCARRLLAAAFCFATVGPACQGASVQGGVGGGVSGLASSDASNGNSDGDLTTADAELPVAELRADALAPAAPFVESGIITMTSEDAGLAASAYTQWWDVSCAGSGAQCVDSLCRPAVLHVSMTPCGAYKVVQAGCIRADRTSGGNACFVRTIDGVVIVTSDAPSTGAGLLRCDDAGLTNGPGIAYPQCADR